jgi:hypothetical protein
MKPIARASGSTRIAVVLLSSALSWGLVFLTVWVVMKTTG